MPMEVHSAILPYRPACPRLAQRKEPTMAKTMTRNTFRAVVKSMAPTIDRLPALSDTQAIAVASMILADADRIVGVLTLDDAERQIRERRVYLQRMIAMLEPQAEARSSRVSEAANGVCRAGHNPRADDG